MTRSGKKLVPAPGDADARQRMSAANRAAAPLYLQVASTLRTAIVRGIYPVGSRVPTEDDLCKRFQVSRHTIREALRRLRADGLISSRQGGRPVVVPPSALNSVRLFSAEMGKDFFDYTMITRLDIRSMGMVAVGKSLAAQLDVGKGEQWLRVCGYRQLAEDGAIKCWHEYFIHAEYAAVSRLMPRHVGPIISLIEDLFSEKIVEVHQSMGAVAMPAEQAAVFDVAADSPALKIVTRCQTAAGRLAMISITLHRGGDDGYTVRLQDQQTRTSRPG